MSGAPDVPDAWVYVPCGSPSSGPTLWCAASLNWLRLADPGGRSGGCYNRRRTRPRGRTWSLHACGRAVDWFPSSIARGDELAAVIAASGNPDVQLILWRGRQWGGRRGPGWRKIPRGENQHLDHLHIESRAAIPH